MKIIVDANTAKLVFRSAPHVEYVPISAALSGRGRHVQLATGGKLTTELRNAGVWRLILELDRQGRVAKEPDDSVNTRTKTVKACGLCRSDDPHVIALAQLSGARLLVSNDIALGSDFTNRQLIDNPRGSVYKRSSHSHLLVPSNTKRRSKR